MPVFLFTDMEGSTRLWEQYPYQMGAVLTRHDAILREQIIAHGGRIIKHMGDGIFAVFENDAAMQCALAIQCQLAEEPWAPLTEVRIRLAIHAGQAEPHGTDYVGPVVNRTYRLLGIAWGGQTLVTPEALAACRVPPGATLKNLGTHLLKDLSEPQPVLELQHPTLPARDFPPLRSLSAFRLHNLPQQATPFVGRESELAEIRTRLHDPACRLLTLIGPGGVGKTRLALQAAADQIDAFPHGVYYVPLATLVSPDFIASTIADTLKFTFYSQENPLVQLQNYLREKQMLLILDNFEHLVQSAEQLTDLLEQAPHLKLLVTSRERLNLLSEWSLEIEGLPLPPEELSGPPEAYSAIQLFVQSARRVKPDFTLSAVALPDVIRLCRLLEGLPLGIELAAAWVRMLSCRELLEELEQSPDVLSTATRDLPQRQRSLKSVFEYSWSLLTAAEQQGLRRLSVFQGPFTREAALSVGGVALPLLAALMDKSLVHRDPAGRYRLHEVVRQYALVKLQSSPLEDEETRARHWRWYAELLVKRAADLKSGWQHEALQELGRDLENIRAAWTWAIRHDQSEKIAQVVAGLSLFYELQGLYQEGWDTFSQAVQAQCGDLDTLSDPQLSVCQQLLMYQGRFAERLSRYAEGRSLLEKSLALAQRLSNPYAEAMVRFQLGMIVHDLGDYDGAIQLYRASLPVFKAQADTWNAARVLNSWGNLNATRGDFHAAQRYYQESLALCRAMGDRPGETRARLNLGVVAAAIGQNDQARQQFQESLEISRELNHKFLIALALDNLGSLTYREAHYSEAESFFRQVYAIYKEIGHRWGIAFVLNELALVANQLQDFGTARHLLEEALTICQEINQRWGIAHTRKNLGEVALHQAQLQEASRQLRAALVGAVEIQALPLVSSILTSIVKLLELQGHITPALELTAFVLHQPTTETPDRTWLETHLTTLTAQLAPEISTAAIGRGQAQTLVGTIDMIGKNLDEL